MSEYVIEMLNITKVFPGIKANDNITLQVRSTPSLVRTAQANQR